MPHLEQKRIDLITQDKSKATEPGDWNYLYSIAYVKVFLTNISYATIHKIRKASVNPHILNEVARVENTLAEHRVTEADRKEARKLAFAEFYDVVGRYYEDKARKRNGDVYANVLTAIDEKYKPKEEKPKVLGGKSNA